MLLYGERRGRIREKEARMDGDRAERFAALRRRFLDSAVADVEELRALAVATSGVLDPQRLDRIIQLAHNLRGTGGAYGFDGIRERGEEVEVAARAGAGPDALRPMIERLSDTVRAASNEEGDA
jgi:HPt (histidine-containing phosphotransfer) domain-containing protein